MRRLDRPVHDARLVTVRKSARAICKVMAIAPWTSSAGVPRRRSPLCTSDRLQPSTASSTSQSRGGRRTQSSRPKMFG